MCVFYDFQICSYAAENDIVIKGGTEVLLKNMERLKSNKEEKDYHKEKIKSGTESGGWE